jgi:hypothetical protein
MCEHERQRGGCGGRHASGLLASGVSHVPESVWSPIANEQESPAHLRARGDRFRRWGGDLAGSERARTARLAVPDSGSRIAKLQIACFDFAASTPAAELMSWPRLIGSGDGERNDESGERTARA